MQREESADDCGRQENMDMQALTSRLSPPERADFRNLFDKRLEKVKAKTADVL
jgi:hypothetical protein